MLAHYCRQNGGHPRLEPSLLNRGLFAERWSHAAGCRRWFNAVRDTATYRLLRERMRAAEGNRAARAEGVAIAREALAGVRSLRGVRGVYVMPPFGRYEVALEVLGS